jgi:DNA-binding transcriptional LysR family regulator
LEPTIGYRSRSLEMVRGFVGHGLGFTLLASKPANNITYDGRALVARPLIDTVKNSGLVLATLKGGELTAMAQEFVEHCRTLFGVNASHADGLAKASLPRYAPGDTQS